MKRILSIFLVLVMSLALATTAFAAENNNTITINGKSSGHEYEAYQIFAGAVENLNESKVLTNITWGSSVDESTVLQALKDSFTEGEFNSCNTAEDVAGVLKGFADNSGKLDQFATAISACLTTAAGTSQESESNQYNISNLKDGYYLVKNKTIAFQDAATKYILEVVDDVSVTVKSGAPTLDKQIKHNESGVWGVVGDNQIGDTVEYRTITTVPETTGYKTYTYTIHDTMDAGLTYKELVKIAVNDGGVELGIDYYQLNTSPDDSHTFDLTINILKAVSEGKIAAGDKLYIYYSATLNENALIYDVGHNDNKAQLEFSNNPYENTTDKTPEVKVYDWTFKMGISKVNESSVNLTGAKFVLSKNNSLTVTANESGEPISTDNLVKLIKNGDAYTVAPEGYHGNTVYVMEAGTITLNGLDDSIDYYLYETKAPDGYNMLQTPFKFKISAEYEATGNTLMSGKPTVSVNDGDYAANLTANVINKTGLELPSTGGIGTTIFYIVGSFMMIGAVVLLITRKKMSQEG